jgi:hypothetical protein
MPVTLLDLETACAQALDDLGIYAVTSSTTSSVTCAKLIDATPSASLTRYDGAQVYVNSQQRRVSTNGLVPSTGVLTLRPALVTPPTAGMLLYLTRLFPMVAEAPPEDLSYKGIVQAALQLLARQGTTEVVVAKDATSYDLPSWVDRPERIVTGPDGAPRITEPHPLGRAPLGSGWRGWRLVVEGETPRLRLDAPFSATSGVVQVEAVRPLHTWVATGGVWAESATGPVNDTDQVMLATVQEAVPAMLSVAFRALAFRAPGRPYPKAAALMDHWEGEARRSPLWDRLRDGAPEAQAPAVAAS